MDVNEVIDKLVAIHREYQDGTGDADKVTPDACPLSDLKGFDSDFIPEIVRRVARELGHPFGKGTRVANIYVADGQKLKIRDIAGKFVEKYGPKGAKK